MSEAWRQAWAIHDQAASAICSGDLPWGSRLQTVFSLREAWEAVATSRGDRWQAHLIGSSGGHLFKAREIAMEG